jgi:NADH-quinone oxidoreductase subunit N
MTPIDVASPAGMIIGLLPEAVLSFWGIVVLLVAGARHRSQEDQRLAGHLALVGLVSALLVTMYLWVERPGLAGLAHMVSIDSFRYVATAVILGGAIMAVVVSLGYLGREGILIPEYYALLLFGVVGMTLLCAASDLITVFLGIELMSLCVYVLVGVDRRSSASAEAALKYFLLGAFAAGFLLYGIALIFGATGTTNLTIIAARVTSLGLETNVMLLAGVGLLLVGFAFKVAAVPFHMWTPDVYDGAPTPVTAFMAAAVKAAAFAAMVRVFTVAFADAAHTWQGAMWWLALITMLGGNLMALSQRNVKRMLAYSSIGHAGYLLAAVASNTIAGAGAFLFYAIAYTLMTIGAFTVVGMAGRNGERDLTAEDLAGLGRVKPWLAFAMAVFMLSLLGFPGTAGFIGKWLILMSVVESGQWGLALGLVVASLISAGFYLPVIMQMYMRPVVGEQAHQQVVANNTTRVVVAVAAALLIWFGLRPNEMLAVSEDASRDLVSRETLTLERSQAIDPGRP